MRGQMRRQLDLTRTISGTGTLLALSASLFLSGCGGGGGNTSTTSTGSTPTGPTPAQQSSVTEPDNLTFSVTEDKASVAVGEPVTLHITLANNTSASIAGTFASDAYGFNTLDPLLFKNSIVQDAEGHYISANGSTDSPASKLYNVPVTLLPGQSFAATLVYTFTRADTYTVSPGVANPTYPYYATPSYKSAGPLTVTVHS